MAKSGMVKPKKVASSRARESRRATSPSIDTDKSLKHVKPPAESVDARPAVLAAHHYNGVAKPAKKSGKVLSRKARERQEKHQDRAEAIMDRTAVKVQKSRGQAKTIDIRRRTWDEINKVAYALIHDKKPSTSLSKAMRDENAAVARFYADDDDEEMDDAEVVVEQTEVDIEVLATPAQPMPVPVEDEEEVL
ncbi:Alb1-domain-containing protein [Podospora appendiculata]|uniref:Alb1-domain-containing protein n=1 Tax=Podospora appendiculata TaxID=314037 RepID=A0AAE1CAY2_9PEZI|nr:Alb1-domain-containing protein [Podospora appendiculata]